MTDVWNVDGGLIIDGKLEIDFEKYVKIKYGIADRRIDFLRPEIGTILI